jgi:hypothetical protein
MGAASGPSHGGKHDFCTHSPPTQADLTEALLEQIFAKVCFLESSHRRAGPPAYRPNG